MQRNGFDGSLKVAALTVAVAVLSPGVAFAATDTALLPRNLSPWNMFVNADIVVQAVMVGLAFASLATWTIWLAKTVEIRRKTALAKRRLSLLEADTVLSAVEQASRGGNDAVAQIIQSAAREAGLSGGHFDDGLEGTRRAAAGAGRGRDVAADRARHRSPRDHRRHRAVRRAVRHGLGHHEFASSAFPKPTPPIWPWWRPASPKRCWRPRSAWWRRSRRS